MTEIIPFDKREGIIFYNGEYVNWKDAHVHVLNHGLHYASLVFEGERVYNRKIFESTKHSQRLCESAKMMDFKLPYTVEEIDNFKKILVEKQNIVDGYVRAFAWRGSEKMQISAPNNTINFAIAIWSWPSYYTEEAKINGIKVKFAKYRRPPENCAPVFAKAAGLYMICTISKHEVEKDGFNDALMLDYRGYLAESTGANLFLVMKNKEIHTPIADCFLNGITRQTIIRIAREKGHKVIERHIMPEELDNAEDVFLTGTATEITRISNIENKYLFQPSEITLGLINDYNKLVKNI